MASYPYLKRFLFRLDPEAAHGLALAALRASQTLPTVAERLRDRHLIATSALRQTLFGKVFLNPVGLAAGFDKDALAIHAMPGLGFGFTEVGTLTPRPQPGNPPPRLFRYPAEESLQNALGFNNRGMHAARRRLAASFPFPLPVGINLGKGRATPPAAALGDYEVLLATLAPWSDYLVINLSSPNTPGLRDLQEEGFVRSLLALSRELTSRPVLIKISPDLAPEAAAALAESAVAAGAAGIIATNTSTDYTLLPGARQVGGISGRALRERSFKAFEAVARQVFGRALLVSAGGIDSGAEAYRRLRAGASLVQVYTALVYAGPSLAQRINSELAALLERDGLRSVSEAIGVDRR